MGVDIIGTWCLRNRSLSIHKPRGWSSPGSWMLRFGLAFRFCTFLLAMSPIADWVFSLFQNSSDCFYKRVAGEGVNAMIDVRQRLLAIPTKPEDSRVIVLSHLLDQCSLISVR